MKQSTKERKKKNKKKEEVNILAAVSEIVLT
jgi:hypothetical protein